MDELERERRALSLFGTLADIATEEREAWIASETVDDPALEKRLRALIAADARASLRTAGGWDGALGDDGEDLPTRIAAYRVTARIGQGGMGSVYRGERDAGDFEHVVAIKVIKPGLLSEVLGDRFRRERQTLAQLSHPNIAQLFDGGEMADGSPYIVMEYVDGRSLQHWVEQEKPDHAARLRLFGDICRAIGFAHRSLIVHRDITPSNVLVTRDGTVKIIDFGIAKAPDAADAAPASKTSIGSLSLTPGYAAPERMTSATVSTAADIYSLGKLLAWLLPDRDEELQAIVARACALDPNDRYPTAEALAEDVAAWAVGLPVAAMAGGRAYVARKFVARNRVPIGAAALALLLLLSALVYALVANRAAQVARAEAEARFQETRGIAKALLFDVFDTVSLVPGSTRARQQLAERGVAYLDTLSALADAPRDVRLEAGQGYLRLAEVVGGGQAGSLSHYKDGDALLARSEAILLPLYKQAPSDRAVAAAYAALLLEQSGVNLYNNGKTGLARTQAQQARDILAPLSALGNAKLDGLYVTALHALSDTYQWDDNYKAALPIQEMAERYAAALPPAERDSKGVMVARSTNLRLLGETYHKLKREDRARAVLDQGVAINRALVRAEPDNPAIVRKLVNSLRYVAVVHRTNGRDLEASRAIAEAALNSERLSVRDANDGGSLHLHALVKEVQAQILADLGQFRDSYAVGEEVLAAHRRLVVLSGNAAGTRRSLAAAMRTTGGNHYTGRDYAGACTIWRETLAIYRQLDKEDALSDSDRKGGLAEVTDYVARACENGPPRAIPGVDRI
jgi:serine/threonine-protein kinase